MINKEVQKKHGFLVSLDELFDTRLAVLEMMDFEKADELQVTGFFTRERDEFPGIDLYEFRKRYAERNIAVLANSTMTNLMINLRDIIWFLYCRKYIREQRSRSGLSIKHLSLSINQRRIK